MRRITGLTRYPDGQVGGIAVGGAQLSMKRQIEVFLSKQLHQHWPDILVTFFLSVTAGLVVYLGAQLINSLLFVPNRTPDFWFDSDVAAYVRTLMGREVTLHTRTNKHPLFSLILFLPVSALGALGVETYTAISLVMATIASLWLGTLFTLLRLMGCRRFDAILFSLLGITSAAAMFWLVLPESYPFGSLSILLALVLVALAEYRHLPLWSYVAVHTLTLSITVTNWMAGILATVVGHHWKKALRITVFALLLLVILTSVQKLIFPSSDFPLTSIALLLVVMLASVEKLVFPHTTFLSFLPRVGDSAYVLSPEAGGAFKIVQSFFCHTIAMPAIQTLPHPRQGTPMMFTQFSLPGSGSLWGTVAVGLWMVSLGLGLWGLFSVRQHHKLRLVLGLLLLGQLVLHLIYTGRETFLYSLHFAPLLVVLAALGTLTRMRRIALLIAALVVLSAGINNGLQFSWTLAILRQ